ncbi:MAG: hypothetical protein EA344_07295 [Alkalicoccus sp.]|nr:MAG: hypothetical protein EA344_07295 [Alkalicoccus sp.]
MKLLVVKFGPLFFRGKIMYNDRKAVLMHVILKGEYIMKSLEKKDGRLYTEARVKIHGEYETFRVLIDTGRRSTVFNRKKVPHDVLDAVSIGPLKVSSFSVELDELEEDGVVGLDFLLMTGAKLNLDAMTISSSRT